MDSSVVQSSPGSVTISEPISENNNVSDSQNSNTGQEKRKITEKQTTPNKQSRQQERNIEINREEEEMNRINTTSFSVMDILDPGKFTGTNHSKKVPWKRWSAENAWRRHRTHSGDENIPGIFLTFLGTI